MNAMHYKGYSARVEYDDDDEIFVGHLIGINDIIGFHADSVAELKAAFIESVDRQLYQAKQRGRDRAEVAKAPARSTLDGAADARA